MPKRTAVLLLLILFVLTVNFAHARPYHGDIFTFYQPDGQEFQVRLFGDEYYVVIESLDSYTLTKDITTGFYCYAKPASDGMSFISTGIKAGDPLPPVLKLEKKSRLSRIAVKQKSDAARKEFGVDSKGKLVPAQQLRLRPQDFGYERWSPALEQEAQILEASPMSIQPRPPSSATTGTRVGLVLLAQFPDQPGDVTVSQSQVDAYANDPTYTGYSNATSVYGYFNIQSNGKLQYNCIVSSYFTAAHNRDYYTDNTISYGTRAKELINEGLAVLKAEGFDFTKADANNDSVLDGVNIFYAGSRVNNWSQGLWPHKWSSSWSGLSGEGVSTSFQYQITNIGSQLSLGTFCHENGHMICNFPDLYSYNGNAADLNSYSLMSSSGSYHPVSIDAYLKIHAGWSTVIDIDSASHLRGAVEKDKNTFYRYRNPLESREYFLLSLRTDSGYEGVFGGSSSAVNPTDGLVIWHAREHGTNTYSSIFTSDSPTANYVTPYELMVVEANPNSTTTPWYDDPNPRSNDAYHGGDVSEASDSTTPALKFWDTDTGRTTESEMHVHSVSAQGDMISFTVGTGAVAGLPTIGMTSSSLEPSCDFATDAASQAFAIFNSGSGTLNYTVNDNVSWLSLTPPSGTATTEADQVTVTYNTAALSAGTYNGSITVTDGGATNSPQTLPVTLTVHQQAVIGFTPSTLIETLPSDSQETDSFTLSNSGGGTLYYTLSEPASWLQLTSTSGTVTAEEDDIGVNYNTSGLADGIYNTEIAISSNNAANSPQTIYVTLLVNVTALDLIVTNTSVSGNTLTPGQSYTISTIAKNQGTDTADSTTMRYYLSDDSTITTSDTELTTDPVDSLTAGATSLENVTVTAPGTDGSYWVGACIDAVAGESNTDNQCSSGLQITVATVPQPDLVVILPSVSDSSLTPNQSYTIFATAENQGTATADSTTMRYYLSGDSTITTNDTELTTNPVDSLTAGATSPENGKLKAPATVGSYWVGACVDVIANESNTDNQCSTGIPVEVNSFFWPLFLPATIDDSRQDFM